MNELLTSCNNQLGSTSKYNICASICHTILVPWTIISTSQFCSTYNLAYALDNCYIHFVLYFSSEILQLHGLHHLVYFKAFNILE